MQEKENCHLKKIKIRGRRRGRQFNNAMVILRSKRMQCYLFVFYVALGRYFVLVFVKVTT